jgi:hypothetical protein
MPRLQALAVRRRIPAVKIPETRFTRAPDGANIAYQVIGNGPDLVYLPRRVVELLHLMGIALDGKFLSGLASFSRLILLDRRGTGRSDPLPDDRSAPFEVDHPPWAGDQDALLREIGRFLGVRYEQVLADRVLATVLFTDIVGSTEHLAAIGDARWKELLASHDEIVKREIERHRGRYIDRAGDGLLATLDGPALAVRCAEEIGNALRPLGIAVSAGVHTGEVERVGARLRGMTVHIGARGGIACWSGRDTRVPDSERPRGGIGAQLRGRGYRWHLYRVADG